MFISKCNEFHQTEESVKKGRIIIFIFSIIVILFEVIVGNFQTIFFIGIQSLYSWNIHSKYKMYDIVLKSLQAKISDFFSIEIVNMMETPVS